MTMRTFVIAEAGVNHNGCLTRAIQLIDEAAKSGADAVKFQSFRAESLVRPGAEKAAYQERSGGGEDQYAMLKALEMSKSMHSRLVERCAQVGIEFMSTPFDQDAADFLVDLGMQKIKIPSGEITNYQFIRHLVRKNLPLILSTGMATMSEIIRSIEVIRAERTACGFEEPLDSRLTILHCTSNYPAEIDEVNLRAMQTIRSITGLPTGYSDHTLGIAVSTAAVALGATVIEKHFTLDRNLPGPDHQASLTPGELEALVSQIRTVERALGSDKKEPTASELKMRVVARRSVTAARTLKSGHTLEPNDLCLLRPGNGIAACELDSVIGRSLTRDLPLGTTLQWTDLL